MDLQILSSGFYATEKIDDVLCGFHSLSVANIATDVNWSRSESRNGRNCQVCDNRYMAQSDREDLAAWLERALQSSKMSQAEVSRQLTASLGRSIDRAAVNKMKIGIRAISGEELIALGRITGVAPPLDDHGVDYVPLISWVSAGRLQEVGIPVPIHDVPLLAFNDLGRGDFFALKVHGDSMDRISPDGSIIIVNRAERTLVRGKPYVFSIRGETTYKMWEPDPVARLEPRSLNMTHQAMFVADEEALEVVGRVRRTMTDL